MRLVRLGAALLVLGVAGTMNATVRAEPQATRVLDTTFSCAVVSRGGLLELESRAHAGTRDRGKWFKLPYAGLRTGHFSGSTGNLLAWVSAGKPGAGTTIDQEYEAFDVQTYGTVGVRGSLCSAARRTIPLSANGLRGGQASALGDEVECETVRRVLVRIRATLDAPATLRGKEFRTVHVPVRDAKLAVRTLAGKPLAYADVRDSGRARLFTAKGCVPE